MGLFRRGGNVRDTDDAVTTVEGATGGPPAGDGAATDAAPRDAAPRDAAPDTVAPDAAPDVKPDGGSADAVPHGGSADAAPGAGAAPVDADDVGTAAEASAADASAAAAPVEPAAASVALPGGPWDVSQVDGLGRRVDLGAIWLPGVVGMQLRMEVDKKTNQVIGVGVTLAGSGLQVEAFAAPRTEGIWDEIRAEIAESVTRQGGSVDELAGPFGRELLARMPVRTPEGRTGHRPARFIGHDGPRWFLRGVLTGAAAVDPAQAAQLEALFADIVVVRGTEARAPRDRLALHLPGQGRGVPAPPEAPATTPLDPLTRGPEITETR